MTPEEFTRWLCSEMPAGTIIGDPAWWAPRIYEKAKAPPEATGSHLADDEGIVCVLASHLAKCDGHDDPDHLIWDGGPTPEPWGEVWCKYEEPAKEILRLVDGCLTPKGSAPPEPEGWRTGVREDSTQVWLTLRGPEGQQAAFAVPNVGIRAEILRGYRAALTKEPTHGT